MQSSSPLPVTAVRSFRIRAPRTTPHPALVGLSIVVIVASLGLAVGLDGSDQPWQEVAAARVHAWWPAGLPLPLGLGSDSAAAGGPVALPPRIPLDPPAPALVAPGPALPGGSAGSGGLVTEAAPGAAVPAAAQLPNPRPVSRGATPDSTAETQPATSGAAVAPPAAGTSEAAPRATPGEATSTVTAAAEAAPASEAVPAGRAAEGTSTEPASPPASREPGDGSPAS